MISALEVISIPRIGLCSTIGAIGILLQYFGFYGLYLTFERRNSGTGRLYIIGNYGFTILGAIVHVLICMLLYIFKSCAPEDRTMILGEFMLWFLVPILILFSAAYLTVCVILFWELGRGRTLFPSWMLLFNPLTGTLIINLLQIFLPSSAFVNGMGFSAMGVTSLVLFAVFLSYLRLTKPKCQ